MNLDTVLMCAQMAAAQQLAGLGQVNPAILDLIDELTIPVEQVPVVIAEPVEQVPEEAAEQPSEA
jgi:hypothetical protein